MVAMKHVIIIPDGAADFALDQLGGRTPLEAAQTPHLDRLGTEGRQGTVVTTPEGMPCGSDVCAMSPAGGDDRDDHANRDHVPAVVDVWPAGYCSLHKYVSGQRCPYHYPNLVID